MPATSSDAGVAVPLTAAEAAAADEPAAIAGVAINAMEAVAVISLFNTTCCLPLFDSLADQFRGLCIEPRGFGPANICNLDLAPVSMLGFKKLNGNAVKP
jgi:hypothetical protein